MRVGDNVNVRWRCFAVRDVLFGQNEAESARHLLLFIELIDSTSPSPGTLE
jgi:hypothetical protein